jgi:hypothetical protein
MVKIIRDKWGNYYEDGGFFNPFPKPISDKEAREILNPDHPDSIVAKERRTKERLMVLAGAVLGVLLVKLLFFW